MTEQKFRANLSRSQGRKSWSVIFTHPMRTGKDGRPLRTRGGLGTEDEALAASLMNQLNELLGDESFWKISAREIASRKFDEKVVSLFYDDIEAKLEDPWSVRDTVIQLPGANEGYTRVLFVGAIAAGKTTLLRQLIGSHPERDRFPSTSPNRTTTFDIEIILSPGPYRGVVSFLPRDRVRLYVEECVADSISSAIEKKPDKEILRKLLEHREQRVRLSYLLGALPSGSDISDEEDDEVVAAPSEFGQVDRESPDVIDVNEAERKDFAVRLTDFLQRVKKVAEGLPKRLAEILGDDPANLNHEDREAFLQLLDEVEFLIRKDDDAQSLIDDLLTEVESKFSVLDKGTYERTKSDWPRLWHFETNDRKEFIKTINRFSSNYAPNFGKLLAPLVQGLRVSGPFRPHWLPEEESMPGFVFIDGEGLGHTSASAATLPTSITKRYDIADVILLVDGASQPMLSASQAVLSSVIAGGHESKLAIVFTRFDQMKGDNLPDTTARKNQLTAALDNSINGVEDAIASNARKRLRRALDGRVHFVSSIDKELSEGARFTRKELGKLVAVFESAKIPVAAPISMPVYDMANLVLIIKSATEHFHENWNARLGLAYKTSVTPEHWAKVKALTRHIAYLNEDYYGELKPVADMIKLLSERIAKFIAKPRRWSPPHISLSEEAQQAAVNRVSQEFYSRLHTSISARLLYDHINKWITAYEHHGPGSTQPRARDIRFIYEVATPIPEEVPTKESNDFLDDIRNLFRDAAASAGANVIG
jgi:hypothetical protein